MFKLHWNSQQHILSPYKLSPIIIKVMESIGMSWNYKNIFTGLFLVLPVAFLIGCGEDDASIEVTEQEAVVVKTGTFKDSAVSGISFLTATQSGTTSSSGTFNYVEGEVITFSIGDITFPSTVAKFVLTPIDLVGNGADVNNITVTNISRFLQTLDSNNNTSDGINIDQATIDAAENVFIDFKISNFGEEDSLEVNFINTLNREVADGEPLVIIDDITARAHLNATISVIEQDQFTEEFLSSRTFSVAHEAGIISELYFQSIIENTVNTGTIRYADDTIKEITSWSVSVDGDLNFTEAGDIVSTDWKFSESSLANNIADYKYEQPGVEYEPGTGSMTLIEHAILSSFLLDIQTFNVKHFDSSVSEFIFNESEEGLKTGSIKYQEEESSRDFTWSVTKGVLTFTEDDNSAGESIEWTITPVLVSTEQIQYSYEIKLDGVLHRKDGRTFTIPCQDC
ncbi:MAG: hypothetical protein V7785_04050 [Bermanella sp.]